MRIDSVNTIGNTTVAPVSPREPSPETDGHVESGRGQIQRDPAQDGAGRLRAASEQINRVADLFRVRHNYRIHEESGRVQVQVIDRSSGEVLDEIPPEQLLNLVAELKRVVGLLFDKKA